MEPCCKPTADTSAEGCPSCGHSGLPVGRVTLKALLRPAALARLERAEYRFCPVHGCDVVYFGGGERFGRADVLAPVFQKQPAGSRIVCYCFEVSEGRIAQEAATTGTSPSYERIKQLVKTGRCACEVRNPQGACCLGNVMELVRSAGASTEGDLVVEPLPGHGA